jgi:prevent-host-death family protein
MPKTLSDPLGRGGAPLDDTYVIAYDVGVTSLPASRARADLYRLIDQAAETHEPIRITGKRNDGVLVSADDWRAIQETLYLLAVPGMRESIRRGLKTPLTRTSEKPGW